MPPRKKAAVTPARALPPPNTAHPCASLLPAVFAPASFADRPHPAAYHCLLKSPFYTTEAPTSSAKKRKRDEPALPPPLEGAVEAEVVQRALLAWFDGVKEKRGMPWRKEVDPRTLSEEERGQRGYEVWVSEIMLQQTRVETVIPYWRKWMDKFPTVAGLAKADIEEVNAVWQGLGYYSRAKRLLDGAKTVMREHSGVLPSTAAGLLSIDGIGPYSAGAISSIAFGERSAMVDGNVVRVLSRLTALHAPQAAKSTTAFIWALADVLVPPQPARKKKARATDGEDAGKEQPLENVGGPNKPGAWNQALMELGATVCTPKNPDCPSCPLQDQCLAYAEARYVAHASRAKGDSALTASSAPDIEDLCTLCSPLPYEDAIEARQHTVEVYPMAKEKAKKREEDTAVCVVEWVPSEHFVGEEGRMVLLVKRPEKGLLAGLYEFPAVDLPPEEASSSTSSSRTKHLNSLLTTLLEIPSSTFRSSDQTSSSTSTPRVISRKTLPEVVHVYSHITRTYLSERIVLVSPSPPALRPAASPSPSKKGDDGKAPLVQSLAGRAKWVHAEDVPTNNIGGAVGKIWEERERVEKRLPGGGGKGKKGAAKAGGKGKKPLVEKGQGSLMGFFAKKDSVGSASPEKAKKEAAARKKEEVDDEVIVIDEPKTVEVSTQAPVVVTEVKVQERSVYKKRRIAPSSDEEDEV
ncbi:A/G-specific adenine glycosylase [Rhodotorula paludigena]|uniref:A/G-specific adenine glycosylase n=1 Tax=Rhodotorula paludigena TaxID=86838 RepID=UPI00317560F0